MTLREGINVMEGKLGDGCRRWRVYSLLLNNLGCTYEIMGRLEESCLSYAKAVVSYKSAEDYQVKCTPRIKTLKWRNSKIRYLF